MYSKHPILYDFLTINSCENDRQAKDKKIKDVLDVHKNYMLLYYFNQNSELGIET